MIRRLLSAVVVRWRGGDEVDSCLQSLLDHGGPDLDGIVLVDSGSADGGAERLAEKFPSMNVAALEENRSFAVAVAQGAARCVDRDLFILNPDTQVTPGAIPSLVAHLRAHPDSAGVVPLLVDPDGPTQHLWQLRRLPTAGRLALGLPGPSQFPVSPPNQPVSVEQPAASAWLVQRPVWDALGGLDPICTRLVGGRRFLCPSRQFGRGGRIPGHLRVPGRPRRAGGSHRSLKPGQPQRSPLSDDLLPQPPAIRRAAPPAATRRDPRRAHLVVARPRPPPPGEPQRLSRGSSQAAQSKEQGTRNRGNQKS